MENESLPASYEHIRLALFLDSSILSTVALGQLRRIKEELKLRDHQIRVYRLDRDIETVIDYNIIACPTLLRLDKNPHERLIGVTENSDTVKAFLSR